MRDIKLTPFILFMILLVVLVIAMIFGYNSNIVEGMNGPWTTISTTEVVTEYSSGNLILIETESGNKILFDPTNGNIIIKKGSDIYYLTRTKSEFVKIVSGTAPTILTTIQNISDSWSANITGTDYILMYASVGNSTLVFVVDKTSKQILLVFKHDGSTSVVYKYEDNEANITISSTDSELTTYKPSIQEGNNSSAETININGTNMQVYKITKDVYYNKTDGIYVRTNSTTFSKSTDYVNGVSIQILNGEAVVITVTMNNYIVVNIITYDNSSPTKYVFKYTISLSKTEIDNKIDTLKLTIDTGNESNDGYIGIINRLLDERINDNNYIAPGVSIEVDSTKVTTCNDPRYMLKTEIVPPVCPACPSCPKCPSSGCTLSINANGEIIDCNGKKYTPNDLYKAAGITNSSASDFDNSVAKSVGGVAEAGLTSAGNVIGKSVDAAGNTVTKTVDSTGQIVSTTIDTTGKVINRTVVSAGELLEKTVDTAGNTVTKTVDTAGNIITKTVDSAGNILNNTVTTAGDLAKGITTGVTDIASGIGTGISDLGKGTADVIKSVSYDATGLISDTGSGFMKLVDKQGYPIQQEQQQQQPGYPMQQQQQQQQGYPQQQQQQGYPMHQQQKGYDYAYSQNGYSNYQTCNDQGSNYLPITNDFSQFT